MSGCAALAVALSATPALGTPLPQPSYAGHTQCHPYRYPRFGFPPGVIPCDSVVTLRFQVTPREALIYVDGFAAGAVDDYDGVFQRLRLVPGPHEIVVYFAGQRSYRQNVYYN